MAQTVQGSEDEQSVNLRQEMIERLKQLGWVRSAEIEEALLAVPRHLFVPQVDLETAYIDRAVVTRWQGEQPISSASSPSIVALMLEALDLHPGQRVLEIGAGTGYNAVLMARIVGERGKIVTLDLDPEIVEEAQAHIQKAGAENVQVVCGDGAQGWLEGAPYDRVILTAAVADLAPAWHEQLRPGGLLVGPLSLLEMRSKLTDPGQAELPVMPDQFLVTFEWTGHHFESRALAPCMFVPLRGDLSSPVREISAAGSEEGALSANLPAGSEARSLFTLLQEPAREEKTSVHLAYPELFGLRRWLALREESFCEIYVPASQAGGTIPAHLQRDKGFSAAIGLCAPGACCLLKLEEVTESELAHSRRSLRLVLSCFGQADELAGRLRAQVETWERAGYPFVWHLDGSRPTIHNTHLLAFPREKGAIPAAREDETFLARQYTCFLFTGQTLVERETEARQSSQSEGQTGPGKRTSPENEHLEMLKLGKERWNQWRQAHPEIQPELVALDLHGMPLKELDLRGARLNGSNLERTDLFGTDLSGADLRGANLSHARAASVNLSGASLNGADLRGIFLYKARLQGARLCGANLEEARLKNTTLTRADLSGANLNFAHLNHVDLEGASLPGASLLGLEIQNTYLPELDAEGDLLFVYQQQTRQLFPAEPELALVSQDFAVGQQPLLVLTEMSGHIHIQGWEQPAIRIASEFALPQACQKQDAVFVSGGEHDLWIFVPHIPRGRLQLVRQGSGSITTAVTATDLRGPITLEACGRVEMRGVEGRIALAGLAGDVILHQISALATLRHIQGHIQVRNAAQVLVEDGAGSLTAEQITGALHCGTLGGSCILSACQQAEVSVGRVGGNAWLEGRLSKLDCRVAGNVELRGTFVPGAPGHLSAGGNCSLYLPSNPQLTLGITSRGPISGDARALPSPPDSTFATLVYGSGQAHLDINAGGGVSILSTEDD